MNVTFTAKDILELRQRGAIDLKSRAGTFLNVGGVGFELERLHSDGHLMEWIEPCIYTYTLFKDWIYSNALR